jgi:hypothetical protein
MMRPLIRAYAVRRALLSAAGVGIAATFFLRDHEPADRYGLEEHPSAATGVESPIHRSAAAKSSHARVVAHPAQPAFEAAESAPVETELSEDEEIRLEDQAHDLIDSALTQGVWTQTEAAELRSIARVLPIETHALLIARVVDASNAGKLRLQTRGPAF